MQGSNRTLLKLNKYISITMPNIIKGIKDVFDDAKKLESVNFLINEGKHSVNRFVLLISSARKK
jgi:hypothetical protein